PEYVAVVTRNYRHTLDALAEGDVAPLPEENVQELVQIFSRGFTPGMYQGRAGRDYITRSHPDNRGRELGRVERSAGGEIFIDVDTPLVSGDGVGFEPPEGSHDKSVGFIVDDVRTISSRDRIKQAIRASMPIPDGWRVVRSFDKNLMRSAKDSFENVELPGAGRLRLDVRVFGNAGSPLKLVFSSGDDSVTVRSNITLVGAQKRALDVTQLREQLGRLGETTFALGNVDTSALAEGLFIPVSELNHLRQEAVEQLSKRLEWRTDAVRHDRSEKIRSAVTSVHVAGRSVRNEPFSLSAETFSIGDAVAAAEAGATEITFDPFLRHPAPPAARVRTLAENLATRGVALRLRLPSIVRPEERRSLDKWLALDLPLSTGHLGLAAEFGGKGRDVIADYSVNCFNQHTASEIFSLGAGRTVLSVELTTEEMIAVSAPWNGAG